MFQGLSNGIWETVTNRCRVVNLRYQTKFLCRTPPPTQHHGFLATALRKKGTPARGLDGEVTHEKGFCLPLNDILQKRNETENIILLFAKVAKIETVILKVATNPLNPKSDQHQISPFNFNTLLKHSGHEN